MYKCGPSSWKIIKAVPPTVNQCAGQSQTPINIASLDVVVDQTLTFPSFNVTNGGCQNWVQFTDDHAFEFSLSEAGKACNNFKLTYAGTTYTLLQGHTHSPSEHTIGGGFYDAELHLVHKSADGKLLVIGVLFEADDGMIVSGSSTFALMWRSATDAYKRATGAAATSQSTAIMYEWDVSTSAGPVDFYRGFLPPSFAYWTYSGSLTTYPCTEGVTWIVMEEPVRISQNDLSILRNAVKGNPNTIIDGTTFNDNRPIQPLKGRTIRRYSGYDSDWLVSKRFVRVLQTVQGVAMDSVNFRAAFSRALNAVVPSGSTISITDVLSVTPTNGHANLRKLHPDEAVVGQVILQTKQRFTHPSPLTIRDLPLTLKAGRGLQYATVSPSNAPIAGPASVPVIQVRRSVS